MNVVLSVLLLILFVIAVGKLTGRLLGIRLGNLRGAIVGLIGWVAGLLAAIYIVGEASGSWRRIDVETAGDGISVIAIVLVFGVLAAMPVAIVIDLITRTGPAARAAPATAAAAAPDPRRPGGARAVRAAARAGRQRAQGEPAALPLRVAVGARVPRPVAPPARGARGLGRDAGQARADRLDAHRRAARGDHRGAREAARRRPQGAGGRGPGDARDRARRAGRAGVRIVRVRAARRRVDRTDPPRRARRRHAGRGEGPAARDRRGRRA